MGQLISTSLATLSNEHKMTEMVDFDDIIGDFAQKKARRIELQ